MLLEHLNTWCKNGNHCVSPLQYQTEETSQLGFLPCSYVSIHAQQLHLKMSSPKDPKREKGWKYSSMRYVLHIGINMWRWQNDVVHGENENKKQAKKQIPKATRIHKDTCQLQAWLWLVDQHIIITASEQWRDSDRHNPLSTWFRGPVHNDPDIWIW